MRGLASLFSRLLDTLAPPRRSMRLVRELPLEELELLVSPRHDEGLLPYRDARVRAVVWEVKYRRNAQAARLAGAVLAGALLELAQEELGPLALVPVPMHSARRKARGYNQTEILCEAALTRLQQHDPEAAARFVYLPHALARVRHTPPQQTLARQQRLKNVRGSMSADESAVRGRTCIVVDDVSTTGSTLAEAERALDLAGARDVHLLALAQS